VIGAGVVLVIAAFIFFIRQADVLAPPQQEMSVDATGALKE
jgi:hypothetical protein